MTSDMRNLYLDLIKKTLSFSLWEEPGVPVDMHISRHHALKRVFIRIVTRLLAVMDLQLVKRVKYSAEQRGKGMIWPMQADTMIGLKRLDNLQQCLEDIIRDGVKGDLIETGVWRGGASIFMKAVLESSGEDSRRLFVADSFRGLPAPDDRLYPMDRGDKLHKFDFLAVSQEQVENNFRKYGLLDDNVIFLKGWFKDTLPSAPINELALIRLDGDMYESTMDALSALYPRLNRGGYCIIDDYNLSGCRAATDEYRMRNGIDSPIQDIDGTGVYWRK